MDEEKLQSLDKNVKLQQFYVENDDPGELLELDNQFHKELFRITNKIHVYRLMDNMVLHFDRLKMCIRDSRQGTGAVKPCESSSGRE